MTTRNPFRRACRMLCAFHRSRQANSSSSSKFGRIGVGERKAPCVKDLCHESLHGGSHAFKDELYHNQWQVYSWALDSLLQARLAKDHGWLCTATVVLGVVLRAAARSISLSAACRDLANGPSDQAVITALEDGLPKTLPALERRLNDALTGPLPRRLRRRGWEIAIDWHLQPYYGQPHKSRNELYYGQPKQGTSRFHAYGSACIVE